MQRICIVLSLILTSVYICIGTLGATTIDIRVNPENPVKDENFSLIFTVESNSETEPYISFDPGGAEVLGRSNRSSDQITIINGKIARKKSMTFIYDMVSAKSGSLYIKDIVVDVDGEQTKHRNVRVKILSKRKTPPLMFLQAEPSKKKVYVGEGFDINYYLYSRVNIMGSEIKAFPKLKNFSKRFKMVRDNGTVIERSGIMYRKTLQYSARVFAEKEGLSKIDPLQLTVQYTPSRGRQSSYGLFGSVFSNPKLKNLRSKKIEINILGLPAQNVPQSFTGLVGKHTFQFVSPRNKYLVNEAVEAKFEVEGYGALESYSAPHLYEHDDLESFDIKSDLIDINHIKKRKTFDYTYLARGPFIIEGKKMAFSYFDPNKEEYIEIEVNVPLLQASGKATSMRSSSTESDLSSDNKDISLNTVSRTKKPGELLAPVFDTKYIHNVNNIFNVANIALFSILLINLFFIFGFKRKKGLSRDLQKTFTSLKKDGVNYSRLFKVLNHISPEHPDTSLPDKLKNSNLPKNTKKYFEKLVVTSESASYKTHESKALKYDSKHFDALKKYLKHSQNETESVET